MSEMIPRWNKSSIQKSDLSVLYPAGVRMHRTEPFDTTVNFHDIGADGKVQQAPAPQYVSQEPNKDRLGQTHTTLVREMVPSSSTQQGKTLFPRYAFVYFLVARVAQTGGRERCTCLSLQQRQKILTIT
jgi:hypothetical protein